MWRHRLAQVVSTSALFVTATAAAQTSVGGGVGAGVAATFAPGSPIVEAHGRLRHRFAEKWYADGELGAFRWQYSRENYFSHDGLAVSEKQSFDVVVNGVWLRPSVGIDIASHVTIRIGGVLGLANSSLSSSSCNGSSGTALYGVSGGLAGHLLHRLEIGMRVDLAAIPQHNCTNEFLGGGGTDPARYGPAEARVSTGTNVLTLLGATYLFE